jgi:hypothetical protein
MFKPISEKQFAVTLSKFLGLALRLLRRDGLYSPESDDEVSSLTHDFWFRRKYS